MESHCLTTHENYCHEKTDIGKVNFKISKYNCLTRHIFRLIGKCSWEYMPLHRVCQTSTKEGPILQQGICWLPLSTELLTVSDG